MTPPDARRLLQEIYVQELVEGLFGVYVAHLEDVEGRRLIAAYLQTEGDRRARMERYLAARGLAASPRLRGVFRAAGRVYGRTTAWLGTRVMLRIAASSGRRASRDACAALGRSAAPDLVYFASLRARNESGLVQDLEQRLIDTAARR